MAKEDVSDANENDGGGAGGSIVAGLTGAGTVIGGAENDPESKPLFGSVSTSGGSPLFPLIGRLEVREPFSNLRDMFGVERPEDGLEFSETGLISLICGDLLSGACSVEARVLPVDGLVLRDDEMSLDKGMFDMGSTGFLELVEVVS